MQNIYNTLKFFNISISNTFLPKPKQTQNQNKAKNKTKTKNEKRKQKTKTKNKKQNKRCVVYINWTLLEKLAPQANIYGKY